MRSAAIIVLVLICSGLWWVTEKEAAREGLLAKEIEAVDNAIRFCRHVLPRLEEYRERTGAYPERVETVLVPEDIVPPILDGGGERTWYAQVDGGAGFEFRLQGRSDVSGRRISQVWESRTRKWRRAGAD